MGTTVPDQVAAAISVASIAELHFGVLVAQNDDERARRTQRLGAIEATFDPLALLTPPIAREWDASQRRCAFVVVSRATGRWIARSPRSQTSTASDC